MSRIARTGEKAPTGAAQGDEEVDADPRVRMALLRRARERAAATDEKAGQQGIVTVAVTDEQGNPWDAGTPVEVVSSTGSKWKVRALASGAVADIDRGAFSVEPGVGTDDQNRPRDDVYQQFGGALWGKDGPKLDDIRQGGLGDCYFLAAMGAVVQQNPAAIRKLFKNAQPNAKTYTVTLHDPSQKLAAVDITVDTELPTLKGSDHQLAYEGYSAHGDAPQALWPAILEKAYAQLVGGYDIEGEGGFAGGALEVLTGVKSDPSQAPNQQTILDRFRELEKSGKAVVVATIAGQATREVKDQRAFRGRGHHYEGTLTSPEGERVALVPDTLSVTDDESQHTSLSFDDDGNGRVTGGARGKLDYTKGTVSLDFDGGHQPDSAHNLKATFELEQPLSKKLGLIASHAYIFVRLAGDKIVLRNPYGEQHPPPLTAEEFATFFSDVMSDSLPSEKK
jgi:hypothetical protein